MSVVQIIASHRTFGGTLSYVRHESVATGTPMRFSVFTPEGPGPFPVVLWLSGLTCTEENFTSKAGAYRAAAELGLMVVAPDTSPRGEDVADDGSYDLGQGAGFYLDATEEPWAPHFRMYSYVTRDLIEDVRFAFPAAEGRWGISGHSMGGHGALVIGLRNPDLFASISAFAPIASPTTCPWGQKAFVAYLGPEKAAWRAYDAALLIADGAGDGFDEILVDQGGADPFLEEQLKPHLLTSSRPGAPRVALRIQPGYDHSYFFISSFIADHLAHHAKRLR